MDEHTSHELAYRKGLEDGKPKWIPVTERLPENDYGKHWKERKYYIVCLQGGRIRVAQYGFKEYGWWVDSHSCVLSKDHYTEVTHWMESPLSAVFAIVAERPRLVSEEQLRRGMPCMNMALRIRSWGDA